MQSRNIVRAVYAHRGDDDHGTQHALRRSLRSQGARGRPSGRTWTVRTHPRDHRGTPHSCACTLYAAVECAGPGHERDRTYGRPAALLRVISAMRRVRRTVPTPAPAAAAIGAMRARVCDLPEGICRCESITWASGQGRLGWEMGCRQVRGAAAHRCGAVLTPHRSFVTQKAWPMTPEGRET